ncbi:TlpA disulfide reductase family protein [Microbulbifer sp. A4B17]|uniref:TlpA family protein disulfide reductase n=1 Tax=Microbulbifer sp. A4B17 TaxID=359370 RepID=UPI001EDDF85F|nr:TlpA disulfide reductase family protein [Microbulbifer sp. A4B17]
MACAISACAKDPNALKAVDGEFLDISGKTLLVNYWAEWCKPCREEIPVLNQLAHSNKDIVVIGINFDGLSVGEIQQQADKLGIEFPVLTVEPEGRWGQAKPEVLPSTFIIGPDGRWQKTLIGPQERDDFVSALNL